MKGLFGDILKQNMMLSGLHKRDNKAITHDDFLKHYEEMYVLGALYTYLM